MCLLNWLYYQFNIHLYTKAVYFCKERNHGIQPVEILGYSHYHAQPTHKNFSLTTDANTHRSDERTANRDSDHCATTATSKCIKLYYLLRVSWESRRVQLSHAIATLVSIRAAVSALPHAIGTSLYI